MKHPIDFVMIWVDSNDMNWKKEFVRFKYKDAVFTDDLLDEQCRYRDWENLQYWFRSVEKYCPWVRKTHIVTCGHFPEFLIKEHPKLNFVTHDQIIDAACLPTFSSHVIEINLHKIEGLTEHFVYFNDDMFITQPLLPEFFFREGLPCDGLVLQPLMVVGEENFLGAVTLTDVAIINKYFNKRQLFKQMPRAFFNLHYRFKNNWTNFLELYNRKFSNFYNTHLPQPFLKSIFNEVWEKEQDYLQHVCTHRFREPLDVNQYLFRMWQLCSGKFYPVDILDRGQNYDLKFESLTEIKEAVKMQKLAQVCLNDHEHLQNFEQLKAEIIEIFSDQFNLPSCFER